MKLETSTKTSLNMLWNQKIKNDPAILYSEGYSVVQRFSGKKGVRKVFAKFTGKYLRQSLFFNKVAS